MTYEDKCCIYMCVFPNNKVYIGLTRDLYNRKKDHLHNARKDSSIMFHRAIRKYGEDSLEWKILEENLSREQADEKERLYIDLYKSTHRDYGYNCQTGGTHYAMTPDVIEKLKVIRGTPEYKEKALQTYNSNRDTNIQIQKNAARKRVQSQQREIICYDSALDDVVEFDALYKVFDYCGFKPKTIHVILNTESGVHKGRVWRYRDKVVDVDDFIENSRYLLKSRYERTARSRLKGRKIIATNKDGSTKEFNSIVEAASAIEGSRSVVASVLYGYKNSYKGWIFKYSDHITEESNNRSFDETK